MNHQVPPQYQQQPHLPTSGKAITALVLGILSIPGCFCYAMPALICGALGLFFAHEALKEIKQGQRIGQELATAGRICSIIGLCLGIAGILMFIVFLIIGIAADSGSSNYNYGY